ncbi:hypothetical protein TSAR_002470 [Trichomalopsis sarcophagae]|uniref:Uncharacterized protein n=1 Tax=Trichomalopsis sarcophagae TaxID=543379 RepID=A0A232F612_9HYME|nr:hypothetical protein TSAR_002470 [Trichomalopsis sarcophagae]
MGQSDPTPVTRLIRRSIHLLLLCEYSKVKIISRIKALIDPQKKADVQSTRKRLLGIQNYARQSARDGAPLNASRILIHSRFGGSPIPPSLSLSLASVCEIKYRSFLHFSTIRVLPISARYLSACQEAIFSSRAMASGSCFRGDQRAN